MIDKSAEVLERIKNAVHPFCTNVSQIYQETPAEFPHVFVNMLDNPVTVVDMDNNECAVNATFEITVYTDDGLESANKVAGLTDAEMQSMAFQRIFGPQQAVNTTDANITRVVIRYNRLIADGDEL